MLHQVWIGHSWTRRLLFRPSWRFPCYAEGVEDWLEFPPASQQEASEEMPPQVLAPELNEAQAQAVLHHEGPLLIFAGAGSGKTRVIVYRIANLIATHRVPPYRILAVTFTNKAAGEMRARLEQLVGAEIARDLWVGTFHATCARILRRHHDAAGLGRNFVIYDDSDQRSLMTRILRELSIDEKRYPVRQVLSRIHREKQEGHGAKDFVPQGYFDDAIRRCFDLYEQRLREANAVDFDDLLLHVLRIAEDGESPVGEELRSRFRHVLVDEFQDVNRVQYRLVRAFASAHGNLCVVGDDDQSIYRWRGADVRIVRGFQRDHVNATTVKLEQNYRSSGNIVQGALSVIKSASGRIPKDLWTGNEAGAPITIVATESEHDEAAVIALRIRDALESGIPAKELAVFYRINAQSRVLEDVLRAERIPYQIIGGMRFFERAEVKDLLSYLRVIANPKSDVDLLRIINVPSRKIGTVTVDKLIERAGASGSSIFDAILPLAKSSELGAAAKRSLAGFGALLSNLHQEAFERLPSDLLEYVLTQTGYMRMLEADDSAESEARIMNLRELVQSLVDYEEEVGASGERPSLLGYLERVSLVSDVDALEDRERVALMTVHAAKGLEFECVFITGVEEELFPFKGIDPKEADDLEEERRLMYVAITRARRDLWITHAARRSMFGTTRYAVPSRFLGDLPREIVRSIRTQALQAQRPFGQGFTGQASLGPRNASSREERVAFRHSITPQSGQEERAPGERFVEREWDVSEGAVARGMRVHHERFGVGYVQHVDAGDDPIATVLFSGWGTKRIKVRFLGPVN